MRDIVGAVVVSVLDSCDITDASVPVWKLKFIFFRLKSKYHTMQALVKILLDKSWYCWICSDDSSICQNLCSPPHIVFLQHHRQQDPGDHVEKGLHRAAQGHPPKQHRVVFRNLCPSSLALERPSQRSWTRCSQVKSRRRRRAEEKASATLPAFLASSIICIM